MFGLSLLFFARTVHRVRAPTTHLVTIVFSSSQCFRAGTVVTANCLIDGFLHSLVKHDCLPGLFYVILFAHSALFSDGSLRSLVL